MRYLRGTPGPLPEIRVQTIDRGAGRRKVHGSGIEEDPRSAVAGGDGGNLVGRFGIQSRGSADQQTIPAVPEGGGTGGNRFREAGSPGGPAIGGPSVECLVGG